MYTSDKDELFCAKLDDAVELCLTRQKPYFFSFLSERRQSVAAKRLDAIHFCNFAFFGGYPGSERKVLGIFCEMPDKPDFPVSAITFKFRKCDRLCHRDFLGALMALGIERETVGDILVEDGKAVVFVKSEISNYIISQISKVGSTGVTVAEGCYDDLPKGRGQEEYDYTVSSLRLDNIVAAICNLSREKTKSFILSGNVSVNFVLCSSISSTLKPKDTLTIHGKGKYILNGVNGNTRKGRVKISVIHFR